jgi:hypothetical protein
VQTGAPYGTGRPGPLSVQGRAEPGRGPLRHPASPNHKVRPYGMDNDQVPVTPNAAFLIRFSFGSTPGVIWLRRRLQAEAKPERLLARWE